MTTLKTENTLTVRNDMQRVLFTMELAGQLSDGNWENTRPHGHWKSWCAAAVVVDPKNVGRNFRVDKDNYNFSSKNLLDCVGGRMLAVARLALWFGADTAERMECLVDSFGDATVINTPKHEGVYWDKRRDEIALFIEQYGEKEILNALNNESYGMKEMRADLNDLRRIAKNEA